jgi:hypothetical protein
MDDVEFANFEGECARFGWHDGPATINPAQSYLRVPSDAGRFDDPSGEYGLLYCAEDALTAVIEVLAQVARVSPDLMERIAQATGSAPDFEVDYQAAVEAELEDHSLVTFALEGAERILDLASTQTQEAIGSEVAPSSRDRFLPPDELARSEDRDLTQRVGSFLVRRLDLDGFAWESARISGRTCFALVGNPGAQPRQCRRRKFGLSHWSTTKSSQRLRNSASISAELLHCV